MSTVDREALVQAIVHATEANWGIADGHAGLAALAVALLAEFLIVPRSDIQGVEYGFRSSPEDIAFLTDSRENAIEGAAEKREWQRNAMNQIQAEAVQRPFLPWTPIPEGGDSDG